MRRPLACALLAALLAGSPPVSAEPRPGPASASRSTGTFNVILVCFDALRPDRLGALGYGRAVTRNLDRFAGGSFLFEDAVSQSAWTLPSVMSAFTSLYPHQHGIVNKYAVFLEDTKELARLSPRFATLAQAFRRAGYATAAFTGDAGVSGRFGFDVGFDVYFDSATFGGFELTFPMALDWLRKNRGRRSFLFVHGYDVHGHFRLPDGFRSRFSDPGYGGRFKGEREEFLDLRKRTIEGRPMELGDADARVWRDRYDEQVLLADGRFGRFLEGLDGIEGLRDDTVIAVFSDHGDEFFEHGGFDHGMTLHEEIIRVALIVHAPGAGAGRIASQVRLIDLMPTLLDLAGVKAGPRLAAQMMGVSLRPLMEGGSLELDAFSETDYLLHTFKRSLRTHDGWKLVYDSLTQEKGLFNVRKDPAERADLFEREPERAYALEESLLEWMLNPAPTLPPAEEGGR